MFCAFVLYMIALLFFDSSFFNYYFDALWGGLGGLLGVWVFGFLGCLGFWLLRF